MDKAYYEKLEIDINKCADKIFNFSPQLFLLESETPPIMPSSLATGVLYKKDEHFYLISASHVFKEHDYKKIGLLIKGVFMYLEGMTLLTQDADNKIDLAVMRLNLSFVTELLKEYSFLDNSFIDTEHNYINEQRYLMAGYPVNMSKFYETTHKREQYINITQPSLKDKYEDLLLSKETHVLIELENPRSFKNIEYNAKTPKLYGISGSGLWYITFSEEPTFKLVGIMIEWHDKDKVTVATKIDLVLYLIDNKFDELFKKLLEAKKSKR